MKKIVSVFVLVFAMAQAADAAPSHITRTNNGAYKVTYDYNDKAKSGWYVGGRAELSLLNFKNKYTSDPDWNAIEQSNEDKYSFESVFGGSLSVGKTIKYFWRAELEAGYLGLFEDEDSVAKFSVSLPYMMVNGYYDFTNGLYVGAGVGAAVAMYEVKGAIFNGYKKDKTAFSPMAGLMLGYSHKLDDNLVLDLRYRLAGVMGSEIKLGFQDTADQAHWFKSKTGMILDNSISLGLRYEF